MSASETQQERTLAFLQKRFGEMGLPVRAMPDGRCLLVSMPIGPAPFESSAGPLSIERIVFTTIDAGRIKCLRPRPLFGLPPLDIRDATDPAAIEAVIRGAWRDRMRDLGDAQRWLATLSIEAEWNRGGAALAFPLPGETPDARVHLNDRHEAILPSAGPLSGLALLDRDERVIRLDRAIESGADLECHLAAHIDDLRRTAQKREADDRNRGLRERDDESAPRPAALPERRPARAAPVRHRPRVLLVGTNLLEDEALREALGRQGFRLATARSDTEALMRLARTTPDLVISEYALGRSDGASLVAATRSVAGIEGIPVVLLDDARHETRRDAARAVGAAGYVVGPRDPKRFVARLGKLVAEPGARRFTRYPGRYDARLMGVAAPCVATELGRGGVFLATDAPIDLHAAMRCEIALPDLGRQVGFEGEVLYRAESQGALPGIGLRFADIAPEDEEVLIAWLDRRERERGATGR
ncbi:MAG: response regulator [Myxococcota bacterium]